MPFLDEYRYCEIRGGPGEERPAVFLDRDGVIIFDRHYLSDPDEVMLIPGAKEKIGALKKMGWPIILVTNQSGISRNLLTWDDYLRVHRRMLDLLGMGELFAAVYANSYLPGDPGGAWRKPNPGMILKAVEDLNIQRGRSVMVGDKWADMTAAARAGIGNLIHVKTGHGEEEREQVIRDHPQAVLIDSLSSLEIVIPGGACPRGSKRGAGIQALPNSAKPGFPPSRE